MWFKIRQPFRSVSIILCATIVLHFIRNDLTLYIHPRYITFTVSLTIISLFLLLIEKSSNENLSSKNALIVCSIVAFIALAFPPQSLSQRTAQLRSQTNVATNSSLVISSYDHFSQDYSHFSLQDWASLLSTSPDENQIVGKKAVVEGFIYETNDARFIARFRLSCCAVDATPISIQLKNTDQVSGLVVGSWQRLEGTFIADNNTFIIEPDTVTAIEEPDQPYVY